MWEDPWTKRNKYFLVLFIYKTSISISWWTRNTFLGGLRILICFFNNNYTYLPLPPQKKKKNPKELLHLVFW